MKKVSSSNLKKVEKTNTAAKKKSSPPLNVNTISGIRQTGGVNIIPLERWMNINTASDSNRKILIEPIEVTDLQTRIGAENIFRMIPAHKFIPKKFNHQNNKYRLFIGDWLEFGDRKVSFHPKDGIDGIKAKRHLSAIVNKSELLRGHKIAGAAYLMSLWFDIKGPDVISNHI